MNRTQYPSDVFALVVLWRRRYKLSLRDLAEMFLIRGFVFSDEAVRDWEAKLTRALADQLPRRRGGKVGSSSVRGWSNPPRLLDPALRLTSASAVLSCRVAPKSSVQAIQLVLLEQAVL